MGFLVVNYIQVNVEAKFTVQFLKPLTPERTLLFDIFRALLL